MKKLILFSLAIGITAALQAQSTQPTLTRATAPKPLTVDKEGTMVGYETTLEAGRLSLSKAYRKADEGSSFKTVYSLRFSGDNNFNNRQPLPISLSRKSFDSVFTRASTVLAQKYTLVDRYVKENNLTLADERSWVLAVKYFNQL